MLTAIFFVALIGVAWKLFIFGIKAAWGITKVICTILLFPIFLIGLVCIGLIYVAIPILAIVGLAVVIGGMMKD